MTQSLICGDGKEACLCPRNTICMVLSYPEHARYVTTSICWINTRRNVYYKKKPFTNTFAFSDPDKEVKPESLRRISSDIAERDRGNVSQFHIDAITLIIVAKDSFQTLFSPHTEMTVSLFLKVSVDFFFFCKDKTFNIFYVPPKSSLVEKCSLETFFFFLSAFFTVFMQKSVI